MACDQLGYNPSLLGYFMGTSYALPPEHAGFCSRSDMLVVIILPNTGIRHMYIYYIYLFICVTY